MRTLTRLTFAPSGVRWLHRVHSTLFKLGSHFLVLHHLSSLSSRSRSNIFFMVSTSFTKETHLSIDLPEAQGEANREIGLGDYNESN